MNAIRRLLAVVSLSLTLWVSAAQSGTVAPAEKPYKVHTTGKQLTIKSNNTIKNVMLWTTGGYRVVEQKEINAHFFIVNIPVHQKTFFLMIGLSNGRIYTEKIGLSE